VSICVEGSCTYSRYSFSLMSVCLINPKILFAGLLEMLNVLCSALRLIFGVRKNEINQLTIKCDAMLFIV